MELTLAMVKLIQHWWDNECNGPNGGNGCTTCPMVSNCQMDDMDEWLNRQEERLKLQPKPEPTPDSLNNYAACLVPTRFAKHDCPGCH